MLFSSFVVRGAAGGQDVTDADLERASAGRTVRVRIGANGNATIDHIPTELYVARVLAAEGEPRAAAAAQEALAIAIRTYAAVNPGRHRRDGFDFCDGTHCQVLRPSTPASRLAALTTASQLLTYEGRPAAVFYSASCGGRSEAASEVWAGAVDLPYLRSADDDVHEREEPWTVEIPIKKVEARLRGVGFDGRRLRGIDVERRSASGRVTRLRLPGLRPDAITGEDFRAAIGARELRSTRFSVETDHETVRFTGSGYGHGVGMCVIGAGRRAARGESTVVILQQYYPGLVVQPFELLSNAAANASPPAEAVRPASAAEEMARRVRSELSAALGIASAPEVRVQVHESLDAFRTATGRPWWVTHAVTGSLIELAPPLISQADGLEASLRRAVAEMLLAEPLAERPAWVHVGAARYYAATSRASSPGRVKCPTDAELTMAVSAPAYRDAELRAEACFASALAKTHNWRNVK